MTLTRAFYEQPTLDVARKLLGQKLTRALPDGSQISGLIVETEAYALGDPALHAYQVPTPRKRVMFGPAGHVYIYATHGVHLMLNIVCGQEHLAESVLVRALEPVEGLELMRTNRGSLVNDRALTSGPGRLTAALALNVADFLGLDVTDPISPLLITAHETPPFEIVETTRIGLSRGADLPWRFYIQGNPFVSQLARPKV